MSGEVKDICCGHVELNTLYVRFIPVVTPIEIWRGDLSLSNSPHVELMRVLLKHGLDWGRLEKGRYYKERLHRYAIGIRKWTRKKLRQHIKSRHQTLLSVKKHGLRSDLLKRDPIRVLHTPFWATRFGLNIQWGGPEIWNGAGRCAAALAVGESIVPVVWVEDKRPGTGNKGKFADKLKDVKGVWND